LFPNRDHQYETILKAVYDAKAAVRYLRKDFENGDNYGIDTSAIFIGGYSAGAITSLHLSYIDDIIDLPNSVLITMEVISIHNLLLALLVGIKGLKVMQGIMDILQKLVVFLVMLEHFFNPTLLMVMMFL
jgi:hypothetical protein